MNKEEMLAWQSRIMTVGDDYVRLNELKEKWVVELKAVAKTKDWAKIQKVINKIDEFSFTE